MKKNYLILVAIAALFTLTTCKKEKTIFDCTRLYSDVIELQSNYNENPTAENCNALKSKLREIIDNCPLYADAYQLVYDELNCTK